ncbi:hypothetical protein KCA24_33435, partial [Escherichia coli]|nr:hypothetical protein [Escherichia coli]
AKRANRERKKGKKTPLKKPFFSKQRYFRLRFFNPLHHFVVKRRVFLLILLIAISTSPFTP